MLIFSWKKKHTFRKNKLWNRVGILRKKLQQQRHRFEIIDDFFEWSQKPWKSSQNLRFFMCFNFLHFFHFGFIFFICLIFFSILLQVNFPISLLCLFSNLFVFTFYFRFFQFFLIMVFFFFFHPFFIFFIFSSFFLFILSSFSFPFFSFFSSPRRREKLEKKNIVARFLIVKNDDFLFENLILRLDGQDVRNDPFWRRSRFLVFSLLLLHFVKNVSFFSSLCFFFQIFFITSICLHV